LFCDAQLFVLHSRDSLQRLKVIWEFCFDIGLFHPTLVYCRFYNTSGPQHCPRTDNFL